MQSDRQSQPGAKIIQIGLVLSLTNPLSTPLTLLLSFYTQIQILLGDLLPHLVKLRHLASLHLLADKCLKVSTESLRQGLPPLLGLRTLTLEGPLNLRTLTTLSSVCPNLRRLFLDKASLPIEAPWRFIPLTTPAPKRKEELATSLEMAHLIGVINSFAFLPKIKFISESL